MKKIVDTATESNFIENKQSFTSFFLISLFLYIFEKSKRVNMNR